MKNKVLKTAFIASLPVMAGYIVLGIGFGLALQQIGYGVIWSGACSVFIFAGSMQYVLVELISEGAPLLTVAVTTLMVNARHLFYGVSMVSRYRNTGKRKPYLIFGLTDETYSLVCMDNPDVPEDKRNDFYFMVTLFNQCYWVIGSLIGSIAGTLIPSQYTAGVDFSMTALFITIFTDQWLKTKSHFAALCGVGASVLCLAIFGTGNFLIPSMVLIAVSLIAGKRFTGEANAND